MVDRYASVALVVAVIFGLWLCNLGSQIRRLLPKKLHATTARSKRGPSVPSNSSLSADLFALAWVIEAARLYFVVLPGRRISFPIVLFIAIALPFTSLPGTPAGLGVVESVIIGILLLRKSGPGFGINGAWRPL